MSGALPRTSSHTVQSPTQSARPQKRPQVRPQRWGGDCEATGAEKASQNKKKSIPAKRIQREKSKKRIKKKREGAPKICIRQYGGAFSMAVKDQTREWAWRKGKSTGEGYGNIHSLQRSPKKGILDLADVLSSSTREGMEGFLTNSLTTYQSYRDMDMCYATWHIPIICVILQYKLKRLTTRKKKLYIKGRKKLQLKNHDKSVPLCFTGLWAERAPAVGVRVKHWCNNETAATKTHNINETNRIHVALNSFYSEDNTVTPPVWCWGDINL